jgi:glycosyltransferase involved in cell wall biosynthesis
LTWKVYRRIERLAVRHAARIVFTARGTRNMYAERYPEIPESRWEIIQNGYDEEDFALLEKERSTSRSREACMVLIHSGILYSLERDPSDFFAALGELRKAGKISPSILKIILRGSGNEGEYARRLKENGIEDIVFLEKTIPYREALEETMDADGLLLFQAENTNHCIPAKMYEYLRAGRPIFALTDPRGDTGSALKSLGVDTIVPLNSREAIAAGLVDFLDRVREGRAPVPTKEVVASYSRRHRTKELACLLDSLIQK